MSLDTQTPQSTDEIRNARGEWRPPYPAKYAPVFVWPLRPKEFMKWLLGYPGYVWPWHFVHMLIAVVTWFYFQPALARCAEFRWDWIAQMFVRNLGLIWLFAGGWHLLLYTIKAQGTARKYDIRWLRKGDRNFTFHDQLWDNIFWSCASGVSIWTAYEVWYMWAAANGHVPYLSWSAHPVYFALLLVATPLWREFHFYWVHRLIHWKPLYKYVHYLHHKNVNPGPWSGLAMHPVEHLIYFTSVLIHWVIPSHPIHLLFNSQHAGLTPAAGHHGFEGPLLNGKLPTGDYFHYLHHRYFECNYGIATLPLDKLFGTFRDGLPNGSGAKLPEEHKFVSPRSAVTH